MLIEHMTVWWDSPYSKGRAVVVGEVNIWLVRKKRERDDSRRLDFELVILVLGTLGRLWRFLLCQARGKIIPGLS